MCLGLRAIHETGVGSGSVELTYSTSCLTKLKPSARLMNKSISMLYANKLGAWRHYMMNAQLVDKRALLPFLPL
jgi:hypothetical protein